MDDFESRLRAGLRDLADEVGDAPALAAKVSHRVRRREKRLRVGMAVAAVAVVLSGGLVVPRLIESDSSRRDGQVVAGPGEGPASSIPTGQPASWRPMAGSPLTARIDHTAVWTGNEMIVWGGNERGPALADGAAYDPSADTWRRLPGAPLAPRVGHSAVWSGTEMLVWGGYHSGDSTEPLPADGAAYDPTADRWRRLPAAPIPPAAGHRAVWTGKEMIVFGGGQEDGGGLDATTRRAGAAYDPAANRWRALPASPLAARANFVAEWTGQEMIVWGGFGVLPDRPTADGAAYDPRSDTWRPLLASPLGPRSLSISVWTGSELFVVGGQGETEALSDHASYDPVTGAWRGRTATPIPMVEGDWSAGWTGSRLVVWGGGSAGGGFSYDPVTDTWSPLPPAPVPVRHEASAVWTGAELLFWGGLDLGADFADGAAFRPAS